jgi:membrane-associated phospholipid phosphatase
MIIRFPKRPSPTLYLDHYKAVLVALAITVVVSFFFIDIPLAKYFENISDPIKTWAKRATNLIDPKNHYFIWPLLFFFVRFVLKKVEWANFCLLLTVSIPFANLATTVIKMLFARARPDLLFSQGLYGFTFFSLSNQLLSFPSGHACTSGAIFGALTLMYPRLWLPLLVLCLVLASTRVILTQHYFGDVIAGVTLGLLTSQWIYTVMKKKGFEFRS